MKDYYKILEIGRAASEKEIKKAYRLLATKFHPDKNSQPDATTKFIELTEAYEVLSNNRRRQHYDQLLKYQEQHSVINEQKRTLWENEVKQASYNGKQRGAKYAQNFDYFSKEVIGNTILILALDIGLGMIFGDITSLLTFSFIVTVIGLVVTVISFDNSEMMILGLLMTIIGGLIFSWRVRRENTNNG